MGQTTVVDQAAVDRAATLLQAGQAASDNGRPAEAARALRAGLRLLAAVPAAAGPAAAHPPTEAVAAAAEVRGRLLVSLAWAEAERGRVDAGFRLLAQAEDSAPASVRPVVLAQRALLLKATWRNDEALAGYDEVVALLDEQSYPVDLAKALCNRSLIWMDLGQLGPARADLRRGEQVANRHGLRLLAEFIRVNLGCTDVIAGDLPAALATFGVARSRYQELAPGRLAGLAVERARALVAAGLFTEADRELAFAVGESEQHRRSHVHADALQLRAEAALLAGRPEAAARWARHARDRFLGRDNIRRAALASLLELRADCALELAAGTAPTVAAAPPLGLVGVAARARRLAARLVQLGLAEDARVAALVAVRALAAVSPRRVPAAARLLDRYGPPGRLDRLDTRLLWRLARAEVAAAAGRPAAAARQLRTGMATLHRYQARFGSLDLQTGAAVHGRDLASAGLAAALASGSPAAVFRWSERARARAVRLPAVRPPADPAAAAALEDLRQARQALRAAELAGQPSNDLRGRVVALQRTVREHAWSARPATDRDGAAAAASLAAVAEALGPAALVSYVRDGPVLHALVLVDGKAVLVKLGGYAAAAEAARRLRFDLDAQTGRNLPARLRAAVTAATRADAATLAASLLDPIQGRLGDRDLVVVPTGALLAVPWAALPALAGRPLTVALSATSWLAAGNRVSAGARPSAGGATLASKIESAEAAADVLLVAGPEVPQAGVELAAIAALHPDATVLTGAAATPAAALAGLDRSRLAHFAAHGHHQPEHPLFSSLELAGGPLFGYDLPAVGQPPQLVILSACDLGQSDVRPGDETLGMVSALLAAGAATVVASVAKVVDETAAATMVAFHRAVAADQQPARALASALSQVPGPDGGAAGFVCFGAG